MRHPHHKCRHRLFQLRGQLLIEVQEYLKNQERSCTSKDLPPQVGVLVAYSGSDSDTAHDVAVHIAAFSPVHLHRDDVDAELVATERRIAEETARNEGKPEAALPKIVEGRVTGFFKENVLLEQDFAKDTKQTVAKVLENAGVTVGEFVRFRVGA